MANRILQSIKLLPFVLVFGLPVTTSYSVKPTSRPIRLNVIDGDGLPVEVDMYRDGNHYLFIPVAPNGTHLPRNPNLKDPNPELGRLIEEQYVPTTHSRWQEPDENVDGKKATGTNIDTPSQLESPRSQEQSFNQSSFKQPKSHLGRAMTNGRKTTKSPNRPPNGGDDGSLQMEDDFSISTKSDEETEFHLHPEYIGNAQQKGKKGKNKKRTTKRPSNSKQTKTTSKPSKSNDPRELSAKTDPPTLENYPSVPPKRKNSTYTAIQKSRSFNAVVSPAKQIMNRSLNTGSLTDDMVAEIYVERHGETITDSFVEEVDPTQTLPLAFPSPTPSTHNENTPLEPEPLLSSTVGTTTEVIFKQTPKDSIKSSSNNEPNADTIVKIDSPPQSKIIRYKNPPPNGVNASKFVKTITIQTRGKKRVVIVLVPDKKYEIVTAKPREKVPEDEKVRDPYNPNLPDIATTTAMPYPEEVVENITCLSTTTIRERKGSHAEIYHRKPGSCPQNYPCMGHNSCSLWLTGLIRDDLVINQWTSLSYLQDIFEPVHPKKLSLIKSTFRECVRSTDIITPFSKQTGADCETRMLSITGCLTSAESKGVCMTPENAQMAFNFKYV